MQATVFYQSIPGKNYTSIGGRLSLAESMNSEAHRRTLKAVRRADFIKTFNQVCLCLAPMAAHARNDSNGRANADKVGAICAGAACGLWVRTDAQLKLLTKESLVTILTPAEHRVGRHGQRSRLSLLT